jgi:hypothetical protein
MNIKKTLLLITGYTSWCGLGFIRGINSYKYNNKYNNNKYEKKEDYLYVNSVCNGFYGVTIYANPVFLPFLLHKEIYRLEVNLRNLKNEKNTKYYNTLF